MTVTFPKSHDHKNVATFEWPDGSAATTPAGRGDRLPHDLGHYTAEAHFRPPYGFWSLAAQQAPFSSLTLVRGRWPVGRHEWLDRVRKRHGAEMLQAEALNLSWLAYISEADLEGRWPVAARTMKKAYSFTPSNPFAAATRADFFEARKLAISLLDTWRKVPFGGALVVSWPPSASPLVLQTDHGAAAASTPLPTNEPSAQSLNRNRPPHRSRKRISASAGRP